MNITFHKMEQRSEEWYNIRRGLPTASQAHRLITPKRHELSSQYEKYARELAIERFLDENLDGFSGNAHTRRGELAEVEAIQWYCKERGVPSDTAFVPGFVTNEALGCGCSPDLWIPGDEPIGVEIKARSTKEHFLNVLETRNGPSADSAAQLQSQFSMMVTGAYMWHLLLYHPRLPLIVPILRNETIIESLRQAVNLTNKARDSNLVALQEIFVEAGGI